MGTGTATTMTIKRLRRVKRSVRPPVRGPRLRPAPLHEAAPAPARGPRILRSRAKRGVPADEGAGAGNVNASALYRLMAWLSPGYPIGAYSYSSGIEWAVEAGHHRCGHARAWLAVVIGEGGGFCDAVFFVHAHARPSARMGRAARGRRARRAFAPSKERHLETTAQGRAFLETTRAAWPRRARSARRSGTAPLPTRSRSRSRAPGTASRSRPRCTLILHAVTAN